MRNAKLGLFSMLCAVFMFWITTAFDINVWPESYYWTLTLNRVNIMKSYGITWIVLDGTWYEISIASGATPWYWKISVYQICWQGWWNCKQVSQLSTTTPVMNSITDNWLVEKTNGVANKVWKTNARWEPQWLDDATGSVSVTAYTAEPSWGNRTVDVIVVNGHTGKITLPNNPHYVWTIVAAASNSWTGNSTSNTTNTGTYLNYVENSTVKSHIQIKWSGSTTVSAKNWTITITSTGWWDWNSFWQTGNNDILKPNLDTYQLGIGNTGIVLKGSWYQYCNDYGNSVYGPVIGYESSLILKQYNTSIECVTSYIAINMNWLWIGWIPTQNDNLLINGSAKINWNYLRNNKVWLQKIPTSAETLQVNGWIQITENNTPYNNKTCDESLEGSIEYYSGNFYGCNGSKRKAFSFWAAL